MITGMRSQVSREMRGEKEDKENNENTLNRMEKAEEEDEGVKKNIRNNYAILKWMINYSRFAAKLLPKI